MTVATNQITFLDKSSAHRRSSHKTNVFSDLSPVKRQWVGTVFSRHFELSGVGKRQCNYTIIKSLNLHLEQQKKNLKQFHGKHHEASVDLSVTLRVILSDASNYEKPGIGVYDWSF